MKTASIPSAETYRHLVEDLAALSDLTTQLQEMENDLQALWIEQIDRRREDYSILQSGIAEHAARVCAVAEANPEWFATVKTLKTPYGTVGFRSSTKLELSNEELTIALIERMGEAGEIYLRRRAFLNLEALETLEDAELKKLKIFRITTDKCTVTPAKIDLGKAVKSAAKNDEKP